MLSPLDRAVLDALIPSNAHPELRLGVMDAGFEEFYADFRKTATFPMRAGFRAALFVAAWVAPLLIGRLPPLSRNAPADRVAALEALGKSRSYVLRQMLLLLKATVSFSYGANPEVRRVIGFPSA